MKTVLVAYDNSAPSDRALERAATFAGVYDARLIVMTAVRGAHETRRVDPTPPPGDFAPPLARARARLEGRDLRVDYVAAEGDAARAIVSVAAEHDADLIVVGTREARAIERVAHPSVSRAVARATDRDVLIVHPR